MNQNEQELLMKFGVVVTELSYRTEDQNHSDSGVTTHGCFVIDESRFRPSLALLKIVDMICESKNPMVEQQFHNLVTLLELTKENKDGK